MLFVSSFSRVEFTWENGSREMLSRFFTLADRSGSNQVDDESFVVFFSLSRDDSLTDGVHNSKNSMIINFARGVFFRALHSIRPVNLSHLNSRLLFFVWCRSTKGAQVQRSAILCC